MGLEISQHPISQWANKAPNLAAIITDAQVIDYKTLEAWIYGTQKNLESEGITNKSIVLLEVSSEETSLILIWALLSIGCLWAPVTKDSLKELEKEHNLPFTICIGSTTVQNIRLLPSKSSLRKERPLQSLNWPVEALSTMIRTSGSSGKPKWVIHRTQNHLFNALGCLENLSLSYQDRYALTLPLYHVSGLSILFRCSVAGATIVISEKAISEQISKHNITHISMVSTQLIRFLGTPKGNLKTILLGGSAIPNWAINEGIRTGLPLFKSYGLSEMASQVCTTTMLTETTIHSGKPLPYRHVKIKNGEILVKGETLFAGYLNGKNIHRLGTRNDYFSTRDLGYWDKEGNLVVTGRKDSVFISGGENIQPEEIETKLATHPNITRAVVVPVPHPDFGEVPFAWIEEQETISENEYKAFLSTLLSRYKIPKYFATLENQEGIKPSRVLLKSLALTHIQKAKAKGV